MNCYHHPERVGVTSVYLESAGFQRVLLCKECGDKLHPFGRAYGTGLGSQAHAEAQESGRMQREYEGAKPYSEQRR